MSTVARSRSRDPKSTVSALMAEIDVRMANFRAGFCWCSWLRNEGAQLKMEKLSTNGARDLTQHGDPTGVRRPCTHKSRLFGNRWLPQTT